MVNPKNTAENNARIAQMDNIRVFYSKKDRAKYISHLDITRCMQRALKRAGLPVWYTQGFNPHMYMTFALPLPLGYESDYEIMDLRMAESVPFDEIRDRLNRALPPDIQVWKVALQGYKPQLIEQALYEVTFLTGQPEGLIEDFNRFYEQTEIIVEKRTKKGMKSVDIKPDIQILDSTAEQGRAVYQIVTTAGQKNINPTLLTDLFLQQEKYASVSVQVLRKIVYIAQRKPFE